MDEGVADDDGDVVEGADADEHEEGEPVAAREAEDDGAEAEHGDGEEHGAAGAFHGRQVGDEHGHADCADGFGGAEPAELKGIDVEDVLDEHWEEVDCAA